jgi:uncharacterized membrane protein (UPF0136 family)
MWSSARGSAIRAVAFGVRAVLFGLVSLGTFAGAIVELAGGDRVRGFLLLGLSIASGAMAVLLARGATRLHRSRERAR